MSLNNSESCDIINNQFKNSFLKKRVYVITIEGKKRRGSETRIEKMEVDFDLFEE